MTANARSSLYSWLALWILTCSAPAAMAQAFPSRPLRMVVGFPPGGPNDIAARVVSQKLGDLLGEKVVIENRPGAAGNIGTELVARAAPDGYTLLMATATHAINATLIPNPNFDLVKDLAPVSLAASVPLLLAVNPSFPARDVKELVAAAASRPGQINFASGSTGSASHLAGEMLKTMARVDMVHIHYKGGSLGIQDLVAGQVQLMFENMPSILPFVQSERLRGLAVTSAKRSPKTRKLLSQQGAEPVGNSEAEFAAFIRAEIAKWGRVIKAANVKID
jgi:tripartite-type tricarboxylate transporter receptor subunit TctC